MSVHAIPIDEMVMVSSSPRGNPVTKRADELEEGDAIWSFIVDAYSPKLVGHYEFISVSESPATKSMKTIGMRWFSNNDGPISYVPTGWCLLQDGNRAARTDQAGRLVGYANPGFLHDDLPHSTLTDFFADASESRKLTESMAYFLGSFAVRPQMYSYGDDTWGIFSVKLNRSNKLAKTLSRTRLGEAFAVHRQAIEKLAADVWGGEYITEQKGVGFDLPNIAVPEGHQADRFLSAGATVGGFAIHAPIAKNIKLESSGRAEDRDLLSVNYWYACLTSHLLERTTVATQKAFLLGAWDTAANLDADRRTVGMDFIDGFVAEPPLFTVIHQVGKNLLQTFEGAATQYHRATAESRNRGRMPRCKIWEHIGEIGWISELRFQEAIEIESTLSKRKLAGFPMPNVLSMSLGIDVSTLSDVDGNGATENDLTSFRLFRVEGDSDDAFPKDFVLINLRESSAYPATSMPMGYIGTETIQPKPKSARPNKVRLALSGWEEEALDKIADINRYLPEADDDDGNIEPHRIFEFLIAGLASRFDGCSESWVTKPSGDGGVDISSNFNLGSRAIRVVFQAKLQRAPVGRSVVDELRGALNRQEADIGFVVTSSTFTAGARESSQVDYPKVHLIEGRPLIRMLCDYRVGLRRVGVGRTQRTYLDLTFFEQLRRIALETQLHGGRAWVGIDDDDQPIQLH